MLLLSGSLIEVWPIMQREEWLNEVEAGRKLYAEYCASCHGGNLEGQPNWQKRRADGKLPAPPHDDSGHTWHHSDGQIFRITKLGVMAVVPDYESDMPGFAGKLSDEQIRAIIVYIKSKWSEPHRKYQEERNQFQ
jgi:mono/diheme cytochrome c family protein